MEVDLNEIQLNVDELDEVIADTVEALGLPKTYSSFFKSKVLPDLNYIDCMSDKEKFQKYAFVLQKPYASLDYSIEEINIKRVIKTLVPKLFFNEHSTIAEDNNLHISKTDKDIVQYLAGASLRWGIKKFPEVESKWCKNQVSEICSLSAHFKNKEKGSLITPNGKFFNLALQCEIQFRKFKGKRSIPVSQIAASIQWEDIIGSDGNKNAIQKLMRWYLCTRAHISAKHEQHHHYLTKRLQRTAKNTKSLRQSLRN